MASESTFFQPKTGEIVVVVYEETDPPIYNGKPFPGKVTKSGDKEFWFDCVYVSLVNGEMVTETDTHIVWKRNRWMEPEAEAKVAVLKPTKEQIEWVKTHPETKAGAVQ